MGEVRFQKRSGLSESACGEDSAGEGGREPVIGEGMRERVSDSEAML